MIEIVPSVFREPGQFGDFRWMLDQPEFNDALFVFNDNQEQYEAFRDDPHSEAGRAAGGGNAIIRPWQCENPPRSVGIPTGANRRGYGALTREVQVVLDEALARLEKVIQIGSYRRLFYSAAEDGGLGTGIFQVDESVKNYILAGLHRLGESTS